MTNISNEKLTVLENGEWSEQSINSGKVIIFAVPGAFTPTCSETHLPGFIKKYDDFKAKGIDDIYCLSVNDKFVMGAWAKTYDNTADIKFIADGSAKFTKAVNEVLDLTEMGLGIRSKRYAMVVENGEIVSTFYDDDSFAYVVLASL